VSVVTVNRELACLKRMFSVAKKGLIVLKGGVPAQNPIANVSLEREHNERDRVLSVKEYDQLYQAAEDWLRPMLLVAYHRHAQGGDSGSAVGSGGPEEGPHSTEVRGHQDRRGPDHPAESGIDNTLQIRYKIPELPMGVRQSGAHGRLAGRS
jgi:hypothetical protein